MDDVQGGLPIFLGFGGPDAPNHKKVCLRPRLGQRQRLEGFVGINDKCGYAPHGCRFSSTPFLQSIEHGGDLAGFGEIIGHRRRGLLSGLVATDAWV